MSLGPVFYAYGKIRFGAGWAAGAFTSDIFNIADGDRGAAAQTMLQAAGDTWPQGSSPDPPPGFMDWATGNIFLPIVELQWYEVEMKVDATDLAATAFEFRVDGAVQFSGTTDLSFTFASAADIRRVWFSSYFEHPNNNDNIIDWDRIAIAKDDYIVDGGTPVYNEDFGDAVLVPPASDENGVGINSFSGLMNSEGGGISAGDNPPLDVVYLYGEFQMTSAWADPTNDYREPFIEVLSSDDPPNSSVDGIWLHIINTPTHGFDFQNYEGNGGLDGGIDFIWAAGGDGAVHPEEDIWQTVEMKVALNQDGTITSTYWFHTSDPTQPAVASRTERAPITQSGDPITPTDLAGFGSPILTVFDNATIGWRLLQIANDRWISLGGSPIFTQDFSADPPYVPPWTSQYIDSDGGWWTGSGPPPPTYPPFIVSFTPESGGPGTQVNIQGGNFSGATKVEFNTGVDALFKSEGDPSCFSTYFAHNSPFAVGGPYVTTLTGPEEADFRAWVVYQSIPFDPDQDPTDYDMRGYWKGQAGHSATAPAHSPGDHFPDTWKTPYDSTFSAESMYASGDCPFHWVEDALIDSRDSSLVFGAAPTDAESYRVVSDSQIDGVAPVLVATGKIYVTGPGGSTPPP